MWSVSINRSGVEEKVASLAVSASRVELGRSFHQLGTVPSKESDFDFGMAPHVAIYLQNARDSRNEKGWTKSCVARSNRKGLIIQMFSKANLQVRAILPMLSVKCSWLSITTVRFLAVLKWIMYDEPSCMEKLWESVGLAEIRSSSVFSRISWRWWSFIQSQMFVRQADMREAAIGSSVWNERYSCESSA